MRSQSRLLASTILLLMGLSGCGKAGVSTPATLTPIPASPLTATPAPLLPPSLAEVDPPPGIEMHPQGTVTLFFDQAMDRESVEEALTFDPAIEPIFTWTDDLTLRLDPEQSLQQATHYRIAVGAGAQSQKGIPLFAPVEIDILTAGYLSVTHTSPPRDTLDVNPQSAIDVVFNQPIVPLQLDGEHPLAVLLEPETAGRGEWIDTSIYRFTPDSPLASGVTYHARVLAGTASVSGAVLEEDYRWQFTTAVPQILALDPEPLASQVALDSSIYLEFNQSMNQASVEDAFRLSVGGETLLGNFIWTADSMELVFQPDQQLSYGTNYSIQVAETANAESGSGLISPVESSFTTVPLPAVVGSAPDSGGAKSPHSPVEIRFSAPMDEASLLQALEISPALEALSIIWRSDENTLLVFGDYAPASEYDLALSIGATDVHGTPLVNPFSLHFLTGDLDPVLLFPQFNEVIAIDADRIPRVKLSTRNITQLDFRLHRLTLDQFLESLRSGALIYSEPKPTGLLLREWTQRVTGERNLTQLLGFDLQNTPLAPGLYMLLVDSPEDDEGTKARLIVAREAELVLKSSQDQAFLWAIDLHDGGPLAGIPISLINEAGDELARGQTGPDGTLSLDFPVQEDPYARLYALAYPSGGGPFGLTSTAFDQGLSPYAFGIGLDLVETELVAYLYTDRPVYRPGQTVHYRGILRRPDDGRYSLPDIDNLLVTLRDPRFQIMSSARRTLLDYGTFHGEISLQPDAPLGTYAIETDYGQVYFDVAAYRKPEFSVEITPSHTQVAVGDPLTAMIQATYFFGGAVANAEANWVVQASPFWPSDLALPAAGRLGRDLFYGFPAREVVSQGSGMTDADGWLEISVPTDFKDKAPLRLTINVTLVDSSGLPVSGRGYVDLHPATLYLGLKPTRYNLPLGEIAMVRMEARDWDGNPIPNVVALLNVDRVTWRQIVNTDGELDWESIAVPENAGQVTTADDGGVLFSFQPEQSGSYRVRATSSDTSGLQVTTETTIWVTGDPSIQWPHLYEGHIDLVPDQEQYHPGDTAKILVPSPFTRPTWALITLERAGVLYHQVQELAGGSSVLELPIEPSYAPNVYLSVMLANPISPQTPLAMGMIALPVDASEFEFAVSITPSPAEASPGSTVSYLLQASDSENRPVQAEFSLGLADLAAISLVDPNSLSPMDFFYGSQPLRVRTAASLAVRGEPLPESSLDRGIGGGGEGRSIDVRSEFPDTAFWSPTVVTDETGKAIVTLTLPDSLTTWRMEARGTTLETLVGSADVDLISTKLLLIRPVTPRFFTAGDLATVAAVVHNNTDRQFPAQVGLRATGADISTPETITVDLPANDSVRVEWGLEILDVDAVDLTFHVSGGGMEDATKPTIGSSADGAIPVLRYSAPDTVATAGFLNQEGQLLELINLPRRFDATQGELRVTLEPSLTSALQSALEVLENHPYQTTEQAASRLLANLALFRLLKSLGVQDPGLQMHLEQSIDEGLQSLRNRQNDDGGWGWWSGSPSDSYLTSYALLAAVQAESVGAGLPKYAAESAIQFLRAGVASIDMLSTRPLRDRQAFVLNTLASAGAGDLATTRQMANASQTLSLWGRAQLAQAMAKLSPEDPLAKTLLASFETAAIRSATSSHWDDPETDLWNLGSSIHTTADVMQALLLLDPGNPILPGAVRWLIAARSPDGGWATTHETARALIALAAWLETEPSTETAFSYQATLNGRTLASGQASTQAPFASVGSITPLSELLADQANALRITHGAGSGNLAYTAHLSVFRPIEDVSPASRGLSVSRKIFRDDGTCDASGDSCPALEQAVVGETLSVRITIAVPNDQYYIVVEDPFPAGAEPIDSSLLTASAAGTLPGLTLTDSYRQEWGWWWFTHTEIRDHKVVLFADHLPAGTYQYTYQLRATLPGEYRQLPSRVFALYFPEINGQGAGSVFVIQPE